MVSQTLDLALTSLSEIVRITITKKGGGEGGGMKKKLTLFYHTPNRPLHSYMRLLYEQTRRPRVLFSPVSSALSISNEKTRGLVLLLSSFFDRQRKKKSRIGGGISFLYIPCPA